MHYCEKLEISSHGMFRITCPIYLHHLFLPPLSLSYLSLSHLSLPRLSLSYLSFPRLSLSHLSFPLLAFSYFSLPRRSLSHTLFQTLLTSHWQYLYLFISLLTIKTSAVTSDKVPIISMLGTTTIIVEVEGECLHPHPTYQNNIRE
uniref:Uncharacterized protein n=1 Tax=Cacopsylla melanoneura TaxID=428564 RepID=A0A8D8TCR3_9HEMI